MATAPVYFTTPVLQTAVVSATAYGGTRTSPTGLTKILDGSTSVATRVRKIDFKSLLTSVAGLLDIWLYDGTTYSLIAPPGGVLSNQIQAITGSTTQDPWQWSPTWPEGDGALVLPAAATAWTLHAGVSVTQTTAIKAIVHGATL